MFRLLFRSKEEVVEPVIAEPPKQPLSNVPQVTAIPLGAYENLAKELEFCPAQLLEQQIKRFLIEQKIPTYNYEEVDRYLMHIVEKGGKVWIWRPLRERDKPKGWEIYGHDHNNSFDWWGHGSYRDSPKYRPYDKAVPLHILRRVKKIQDRFGNNVIFFVSDFAEASPDPDPFIMVTAQDVPQIIFGVWNEPTFEELEAQE